VTVSRHNAQLLAARYPIGAAKPTVVHYGRPDRFFAPRDEARRAAMRGTLGASPDELLLFTAARFEQVKGFDVYLRAIERLREDPAWPRLRFAWAGAGPADDSIRAAIATLGVGDRVHLLGARDDVDAWLGAADAFVLPSRAEGMPLSIMEAMASGLPVIASAVSGIPEQVGDTAMLIESPAQFPRAAIRSLQRAIATLAGDPALRRDLGRRARQRAELLFHEQRMVVDYARLIGSAIGGASSAAPRDYVSPGFVTVHPDAGFPEMRLGNTGECEWPYLRREVMHRWYVDRRLPSWGFLSRDEAHIVHNAALQFAGRPALEIGCLLGWSTCHLALAGVMLDVVDPILKTPEIRASVEASLSAAGVRQRVNLIAAPSPDAVRELSRPGRRWSLFFIDGDHEGDAPRRDAEAAEQAAADDCMVLFHDLVAPAVAEGLRHFKRRGWNVRVYRTMQVMGVAWRGNVKPPDHVPDPALGATLPLHLADLAAEDPFGRIQPLCAPFTMTSVARQFVLHQAVRHVVANRIAGDIVECGVWRGGSMMLAALTLAELQATDRRLALYDTFAGMTPPDARDVEAVSGRAARDLLAAAPRSEDDHLWAIAPLDAVKRNLAATGYPAAAVDYCVGDVRETMPTAPERPIALLRLDTDWYESTRATLERLFPLLAPGGILIVDDYGWWEGATRACDEYLANRPERLQRIPDDVCGAILVNGATALPEALARALALP
jgi:predicted O-methyltransferase YrrM